VRGEDQVACADIASGESVEFGEPGSDFAGVVLALPGVGASERVCEDRLGAASAQ
jgi:hypothetical protein